MTAARWARALLLEAALRARPYLTALAWAIGLALAGWTTAAPALEVLARLP